VLGSPGIALALDAVTFLVAGALFAAIRVPRRPVEDSASFVHELREGWHEFTRQTWLWSTVLLFGISNFAFVGCWAVLGPLVAKEQLGGAGAWATIATAWGVGAVLGGLAALRYRPRRPLLVSVLVAWPLALQLALLALYAPVWLLAASAMLTGGGIALHLALWFTVFQRQVPERAQSRVSSYDALGSFVLIPLGMAVVGPLAAAIGVQQTLWIGFAVAATCQISLVFVPSVRALRATELEATPTA
jgi:hypothetical protein